MSATDALKNAIIEALQEEDRATLPPKIVGLLAGLEAVQRASAPAAAAAGAIDTRRASASAGHVTVRKAHPTKHSGEREHKPRDEREKKPKLVANTDQDGVEQYLKDVMHLKHDVKDALCAVLHYALEHNREVSSALLKNTNNAIGALFSGIDLGVLEANTLLINLGGGSFQLPEA